MLGTTLRNLREARNLTQEELAERLDIGVIQIYRYENGKTQPNAEMLGRIASTLNVSADYLLGLSPDPTGSAALSPLEKKVLNALRQGNYREAIRVIVADE